MNDDELEIRHGMCYLCYFDMLHDLEQCQCDRVRRKIERIKMTKKESNYQDQ